MRRVLLLSWSLFGVDCTLGDYELASCDPSATKDSCNDLAAPDPCSTYQCDPSERRCVLRPRDDDRDGDPSPSCGGHDCDDANPKRSSRLSEVCDGIDNDCNGLVDDHGVLTPGPASPVASIVGVSSVGGGTGDVNFNAGPELVASFVQTVGSGRCLRDVSVVGGPIGSSTCTFLGDESSLQPRHPSSRKINGVDVAAFITTSGCPQGAVEFRSAPPGTVGRSGLGCGKTAGASLTALASLPGGPAVVAFYDAAPATRDDPLSACAKAASSTLHLAAVLGPSTASPLLTGLVTVANGMISVRSPALVEVDDGLLLASPTATGASVFTLAAGGAGVKVVEPHALDGFDGARSTALAVARDGTSTRLALAAEIGCIPSQSIRVAFGTIEATRGPAFGPAIELATTAPLAAAPSVAWIATRREWLVGYLSSGPRIVAHRFDAIGRPIDAPLSMATGTLAFATSPDADVFAFDGNAFTRVPLHCPR